MGKLEVTKYKVASLDIRKQFSIGKHFDTSCRSEWDCTPQRMERQIQIKYLLDATRSLSSGLISLSVAANKPKVYECKAFRVTWQI